MTSEGSDSAEALRRRDTEFQQFYAETRPGLINFLRRQYSAVDAEAIAHDAYIRALDRWDAIQVKRPFLFKVARRLAIDSATKATAHVSMDAVGELVDLCQSDPAFAYDVQETLDAAGALPPAQREVVLLLVAGATLQEVAAVTGKTMWAVWKARHRALHALAKQGLGDPREQQASTAAMTSATGDDPGPPTAAHDNDTSDTCGIGAHD